jgi:hypothetical protein
MYGIVGRAQRQQPAHTAFSVKPAHTVRVVNNFNFNFNFKKARWVSVHEVVVMRRGLGKRVPLGRLNKIA